MKKLDSPGIPRGSLPGWAARAQLRISEMTVSLRSLSPSLTIPLRFDLSQGTFYSAIFYEAAGKTAAPSRYWQIPAASKSLKRYCPDVCRVRRQCWALCWRDTTPNPSGSLIRCSHFPVVRSADRTQRRVDSLSPEMPHSQHKAQQTPARAASGGRLPGS